MSDKVFYCRRCDVIWVSSITKNEVSTDTKMNEDDGLACGMFHRYSDWVFLGYL